MNALVLTVDRNSPGKKDFSGAFLPEALGFARLHGVPAARVVRVDIGRTKADRRKQVLAAIEGAGAGLELVAFLCHGLRTQLPQLGWTVGNVRGLGAAIAGASVPSVRVVLYACSTGEGTGADGDGGLADGLRDALCVAGARDCQVDAHERAAHTTQNPYVRRFPGLGSPSGGAGGAWIVTPGSAPWARWRKALRGDLRFRFPLLSTAAILGSL